MKRKTKDLTSELLENPSVAQCDQFFLQEQRHFQHVKLSFHLKKAKERNFSIRQCLGRQLLFNSGSRPD